MRNAIVVILLLVTGFLADRRVRIENQRYAIYAGLCKSDPVNATARWNCLENVQTRTSWFWHLYYATTEHAPAVPL
jgi:hypothetical protein